MDNYAIIGGGIIGMLTAFYLLEEGKSVKIYDKGVVGSESSWAGGGILSPLYPWRYSEGVSQLSDWGKRNYPSVLEKIYSVSGIDPEYRRSGLICHNLSDEELETAITWCDVNQVKHEHVKPEDLERYEPNLSNSDGQVLLLSDIAQVRNPRLVKSLRQYLILSGVEIFENEQIDAIDKTTDGYQLVANETVVASVSKVVIASGAWSSPLLRSVGLSLEVEPVKGQMILYSGEVTDLHHIVLSDEHYLIPRSDGQILAGSTLERVGFDKSVTEEAHAELSTFAEQLLPILKERVITKQWSGLRPALSDSTPVISEVPEMDGVYVNTGHFRNGVVTGLAAARIMVDIAMGVKSELSHEYYSVATKSG